MQEIFLGEVIRRRRQDLRLTQAQLSEGICEQATISRFENGTQTPSRNRIKTLLQRLGLPDDRFYALLTNQEDQVRVLQKKMQDNAIEFELTTDEDRPLIWEKTMDIITKLEAIIDPDDVIVRQHILSVQATIGKMDGAYTTEEKIVLLMEAIRMTVPRLDLEDLRSFRYSTQEFMILNKIALTYAHMGQKRQAIDIYRQLLAYVEKNNTKLSGYAAQFSLIAHNYALQLSAEKRYEESAAIASQGYLTCVKQRYYQFLPDFLAIMGENYFFLGDREKSAKCYRQAYCLYEVTRDDRNRTIIAKEMKEYLGLEPPW